MTDLSPDSGTSTCTWHVHSIYILSVCVVSSVCAMCARVCC